MQALPNEIGTKEQEQMERQGEFKLRYDSREKSSRQLRSRSTSEERFGVA